MATGACFDSDEKFRVAEPAGTTSTAPPPTSTTTVDPTTTGASSTSGEPDLTCRGGIQCIVDCAFEIAMDENPEPDLGCILDCSENRGLGQLEAYHLLRLANCVSDECAELGCCDTAEETSTGTSTGTSTSTGSGTGTGTGTGTAGTGTGNSSSGAPTAEGGDTDEYVCVGLGGGLLNECLVCVFDQIQTPREGVCEEEHDFCM